MIKYFTPILFLVLATQFGWSQRTDYQVKATNLSLAKQQIPARTAEEAVFFPTDGEECADRAWLFPVEDDMDPSLWGFIAGTNNYGDTEKAQRLTFTASEMFSVVGVLAFFETPAIIGDGMLSAKVYSVEESTGAPATLLGESMDLLVSEIIVPDSFVNATPFLFSEDMPIAGDGESFFVSIDIADLYASGDTVTLFQTESGCGNGDDTYDRFSDGSWVPVNSDISWQLDSDYFLGAVVEFDEATSTDAYIANGGLKLHPTYPNPARHHVFIRYSLDQPSSVKVEVFDLTGRKVMEHHAGLRSRGTFEEQLRTEPLTEGTYFYRLVTDHGKLASRFHVRR